MSDGIFVFCVLPMMAGEELPGEISSNQSRSFISLFPEFIAVKKIDNTQISTKLLGNETKERNAFLTGNVRESRPNYVSL